MYASCGLQNGDVLRTINGMDISSPDKALDAYSKMKGATQLVIAIERRGTPQTVTIDLER